jgi:hypothetical protein
MSPLKVILFIKIFFTAIFWSLPLLFFPREASELLGAPVPDPLIYIRLLGAAFFALLIGYIHGLIELYKGRNIGHTVIVGTVSNGLAGFLLLIYKDEWALWSTNARCFMWVSVIVTLSVAAGLVVYGRPFNDSSHR